MKNDKKSEKNNGKARLPPGLISLHEAAKILDCSNNIISEICEVGEIKILKIKNRKYVCFDKISEFIDSYRK